MVDLQEEQEHSEVVVEHALDYPADDVHAAELSFSPHPDHGAPLILDYDSPAKHLPYMPHTDASVALPEDGAPAPPELHHHDVLLLPVHARHLVHWLANQVLAYASLEPHDAATVDEPAVGAEVPADDEAPVHVGAVADGEPPVLVSGASAPEAVADGEPPEPPVLVSGASAPEAVADGELPVLVSGASAPEAVADGEPPEPPVLVSGASAPEAVADGELPVLVSEASAPEAVADGEPPEPPVLVSGASAPEAVAD